MAKIHFVSLSKQFLPVGILVMTAVFGIIFVLSAAKAEAPASSEAAVAVMKEMFGKISFYLTDY